MRTYTIDHTGQTFRARTHREAWSELASRLRVDGPRALVATTEDGAEIRSSLYEGEDYILDAAGRRILA